MNQSQRESILATHEDDALDKYLAYDEHIKNCPCINCEIEREENEDE